MPRSSRLLALSGIVLLAATASFAQSRRVPRDYDALGSGPRPRKAPATMAPASGRARGKAMRTLKEQRLGLPTFLWAGERGRMVAAQGRRMTPAEAARMHLNEFAPDYRLTPADVNALRVRSIHDAGRGPIIVSFSQQVNGIDVFRDEMKMVMDRDRDLIAIAGYLTHPEPKATVFNLSAAAAIARALEDLTGESFTRQDLRRSLGPPSEYEGYRLTSTAQARAAVLASDLLRAKKVFCHLADGFEPAYMIDLSISWPGDVESLSFGYVISAMQGQVLMRKNFTVSEAFIPRLPAGTPGSFLRGVPRSAPAGSRPAGARIGSVRKTDQLNSPGLSNGLVPPANTFTYRVWAGATDLVPFDGPQGTSPSPHPTGVPDGFQPPLILPGLVTLVSGPISTQDPWLLGGTTVTSGNNVDAYADLVSPGGFSAGDFRASTTSTNVFDRTYDTTLSPQANTTQQMAAVTQLFYVNNFLHDWFYDSGFDEISGNGQVNNFGRGGLGSDPLLAEAQDFSGRNNANMSTPPDGSRPRMQMFIFDGTGDQFLQVNAPASIAGQYAVGAAQFGPQVFDTTGDVVLVNDGAGATSDGCDFPFSNASALVDKIALIDRGTCTFATKVLNAEDTGAIATIIANNTSGVITMGGSGPISTPSLMISQADGNTIKAQLGGVVNARLLRAAAVDTDGTIDNQIVAHEWGHFISNRLVGNAFGLNTKMAGGLGEGWADFHALLMTIRLEDTAVASNATFNGAYPVAGYVIAGGGNNAYYFGIRRAPYSTSFAINPLTFRHIADGVPLPATAPLAFGQAGTNNSEVHNTGEIWANMLWECYAALLRDTQGPTPRLTFGQAQQRMKDYLVAGYKLTPNSPTLLDARNAILAGILASDPVDFDECWAGFARRGAGVGAVAPDPFSSTNQGVIESFLTGGALETRQISLTDDVATQCLPDGELDNNETGTLTITLANSGSTSLSSTTGTVTSTNPAVSFPAGNALAFPASGPFQTITTAIPVTLGGALSAEEAVFDIQFDDPGLAQAGPLTASLSVRVNSDDVPNQSAADDVESNIPAWAIANDPALDTSLPWGRIAISGVDHRWLGPDTGAASDQYLVSPPLQVALTGTFGFTFRHRHDFEASGGSFFDGGVIEISTDGGASWTDIGGSALPGYGAVPIATGGNNPIEGRQAYVATNPSFPALDTVTVSLGTAFQGQTVLVRFRIGTDVFVGAAGWEIDDIAFNNITNTPFSIVVAHDPTCDADADGFFDATDCAPSDPMLWSAPAAVADLDLAGGSSTTFNWSVPVDAGGAAAPTYDLLRSVGATGFSGATCVEIAGIDTTAADPTIPGTIFYYMVGAANTCGRTFAPDSAGSPRTVTICGP